MRRLAGNKKAYLIGGVALFAVAGAGVWLMSESRAIADGGGFLRDGEAGFIVTHISYALGPDTQGTAACPDGMSKNVAEIFALSDEGQRQPGEGDEEYGKRMEAGGQKIAATADGKNYCMHPQLAPRDTHSRLMLSASHPAEGIDLDGQNSRGAADRRSGRLDFIRQDGVKGVDNQFWRAVGCTRAFQSSGPSNGFETEMYTGSWGVLMQLADVDDLQNDDHVRVGIYANADPIRLSPTREALEYSTYAKKGDPRMIAETTGRIENGVLLSDPVDIRFPNVVNGMHLERSLRDARIEATLSKEGVLKGYLAGYGDVEETYNYLYGFRNGKNGDGTEAAIGRRVGSANGAARVLGYTCAGAYQALNTLADGHPVDGKYTSISTQYKFEARPAFIVEGDDRKAKQVKS